MADDTWSAGLNCNMLDLGVDFAAQALSKYIGGHADLLLGAVLARGETARRLRRTEDVFGFFAAAEDCALALRGLRTASLRMERSAASALTLSDRLAGLDGRIRLLYPPRPDHPDHDLYVRDFTGAAGLFGVVFEDWDTAAAQAVATPVIPPPLVEYKGRRIAQTMHYRGGALPRRPRGVRAGLLVGRLQEPGDSLRPAASPRSSRPPPGNIDPPGHRPRGRRRPVGRPRTGHRGGRRLTGTGPVPVPRSVSRRRPAARRLS